MPLLLTQADRCILSSIYAPGMVGGPPLRNGSIRLSFLVVIIAIYRVIDTREVAGLHRPRVGCGSLCSDTAPVKAFISLTCNRSQSDWNHTHSLSIIERRGEIRPRIPSPGDDVGEEDKLYGRSRSRAGTVVMTSMRAAVLTSNQTLMTRDSEVPVPEPDEALVAISHVGICGSDVHFYREGHIGRVEVDYPFVLGHESAGRVVEIGSNVTSLDPGDEVAIEPGIPCGRCPYCKRGKYELCPDVKFMGSPPDDGALTEYVSWHEDFIYPLPDGMSTKSGALCEPLSCGLHTVWQGGVETGDSVLVTGSGPIGILAMAAARGTGATDVVITGRHDEKLAVAEQMGATRTVNVQTEDALTAVQNHTEGRGVDVVVEAAGSESAIDTAMDAVRPGGTVVLYGMAGELTATYDVMRTIRDEITIRGAFRYANTYPAAISLVEDGRVDVESIIDFEMPLVDADAAFQRVIQENLVKGMISVGN